jgi:beta-glucosidase
VHDVLGDRVRAWSTLNEPWCSAFVGYVSGEHAPGRQDPAAGVAAAHHLMLGHGLAVGELRARDSSLSLGITLNLSVVDPVDPEDAGDREAVRRIDGQFNRIFLDPLFRGEYPDDVREDLAGSGLEDVIRPGDLSTISRPIDTLGVNYYHGEAVSAHPAEHVANNAAPSARPLRSPFVNAESVHFHKRGLPVTAMDWEVQPEGLTRLLRRVHDEYTGPAGVALAVTENGSAFADAVEPDGSIEDSERTRFLVDHLAATLDAIDDGIPVNGYFAWSLLDNFEWAWGYDKRFGIVRVDYDTQVRTPKRSALTLKRIIGDRALPS